MSRTIEQIVADLEAVQNSNRNWASDPLPLAMCTELVREKNLLTEGKSRFPNMYDVMRNDCTWAFSTCASAGDSFEESRLLKKGSGEAIMA